MERQVPNALQRTRALCYFRNLVYTTYREARHLGTKGWHPAFTEQAVQCREAARLEKERRLFKTLFQRIRNETNLARIVAPFAEATGLNLADLPAIFGLQAKWEPAYGGKRWQAIADLTIALRDALQGSDQSRAYSICGQVKTIAHNTGQLVDPSKPYKWPADCDS